MEVDWLLWGRCLLLAVLPISELRGALPFAVSQGVPFGWALILAVGGNLLVAPLAYAFLNSLHKVLSHLACYQWLMTRIIANARRRVATAVARYGFWGLLLFVGIPLPITGAWTATLGAWLLNLSAKKTLAAVSLGVLMSATLVSLMVLGLANVF